MTINEKTQLSRYIKGLVQESIGEMYGNNFRSSMAKPYGVSDEDYFGDERQDEFSDEEDDDEEIDGLDELRKLCEGFARNAVKSCLSESKKKSTRKSDGKKKGSKKGSKKKDKGIGSQEKSIMNKLNSDEVNSAAYYYKLYGAETEAEKASARSKGYKKAKGKKNDSGARYKFSSKERNRLNSMLTDK